MKAQKDLREEHHNLELLKQLAEAYAEIASKKMKETRDGVLNTRGFLGNLQHIFDDVRYSYRQTIKKLQRRRRFGKGERVTFLAHNGKTVAVFLAANTGLYGEIVAKTFRQFADYVKAQDVEATIVGRLGLSLYLESQLGKPYTFFQLPDQGMDVEKLLEVIKHLVQYERVVMFYGQYQSVVKQEPVSFEVVAEALTGPAERGEDKKRLKYYFEPTLEEILKFFESQMFASIVEQTVRESQLAKYASRMLSMDQASQRIDKRLEAAVWERLRLKHSMDNRKQLNLFSGMHLW